ncbi:hypothetical protein DFJ74DRAFT_606769 [Hyaloraphidium curvatum]|nr:hypothetical protein DFJ74DRAFT_606769 [Hyaloraphidium curvatum]
MAPVAAEPVSPVTPPASLPPAFATPDVWVAADVEAHPERWTHALSAEEIAEFDAAIAHFLSLGLPLSAASRENFPLGPRTAALAERLRGDLYSKHGFALLKGLPVDRWTREQVAAFTLGFGRQFGSLMPQNKKGHLLGHVKDIGHDPSLPTTRIYATHERQRFHTDEADTVGLVCLEVAESGGESLMVSSAAVYNHLLEHDPASLKVLMEPFYWDRKDEQAPGEAPYGLAPVLIHLPPKSPGGPGRLASFQDRNFLRTASRHAGVPPLTPAQLRALDALDAACEKLAMRMTLERGDMQLLHNNQALHDRTAFVDRQDRKRHLLRLWLRREGDAGDWEMPEALFKVRSSYDIKVRTTPLEAE